MNLTGEDKAFITNAINQQTVVIVFAVLLSWVVEFAILFYNIRQMAVLIMQCIVGVVCQ